MPAQNNSMLSFPFGGLIWKISADSQRDVLVLELRSHEEHQVDFAAIDLKTNQLLWQGVKPEETWWLGMDTAFEGRVYLHTYKDPQNPEHEGIFVLDSRSGKLLWKDSARTFYHAGDDSLIVTEGNEDSRKYISLDPATGKVRGEYTLKDVFRIAAGKKEEEEGKIRNPYHFSAEHPYFSKITSFIKEITGEEAVVAADYLENGEQVIISFYLYSTEGLTNYVIVVDEEGRIAFRECMASRIKGIGFDTFFMFEQTLLFVKEKKELIFLKLS
ncbi:MAG: DUF4905 domain-containing protein [Cytophagaceae bacterium]